MNGYHIILICVSVILLCVKSDSYELRKPDIEKYTDLHAVEPISETNKNRRMDSIVYQTVNKYYCSLHSVIEGSHLIVYGSKGWTFPIQDVNLTLRYPTEREPFESDDENEDYIITGFKVILYIDGPQSRGYIMNGGVLQDTIMLTFVSKELTSLRYEFWLYGVRKDTPGATELNAHYRLC